VIRSFHDLHLWNLKISAGSDQMTMARLPFKILALYVKIGAVSILSNYSDANAKVTSVTRGFFLN
jgi:hypothetical protein